MLLNAVQVVNDESTINVFACMIIQQRKKYEDEILQAKKLAEETLNKNEELNKARQELEAGKQELDRQVTQLKYSNKELIQLNNIITHDLQEPVRKIGMFTNLLQEGKASFDDDKSKKHFGVILKSALRIQDILKSLQEYMMVNMREVQKENIDLEILVKEQLTIVSALNGNVQFNSSVVDLPAIVGDSVQIKILFYQLIKNCFDFRSLERDLFIRFSASSIQQNFYNSLDGKYRYVDAVIITLEDNGKGFNSAYKNLIFKILKKLDLDNKGLGFGLSMCKRIVENHRGSISAMGFENKGAKFTITLPLN